MAAFGRFTGTIDLLTHSRKWQTGLKQRRENFQCNCNEWNVDIVTI